MSVQNNLKEDMRAFYNSWFSDQSNGGIFSFLNSNKDASYDNIFSNSNMDLKLFENMIHMLFTVDIQKLADMYKNNKAIFSNKKLLENYFEFFKNIHALLFISGILTSTIVNNKGFVEYSSITTIIFKPLTKNEKSQSVNDLQFEFNDKTLTISTMLNYSFTYQKNSQNDNLLIKPYLDYLLSFNQYNYIDKISAFCLVTFFICSYNEFYIEMMNYYLNDKQIDTKELLLNGFIKDMKFSSLMDETVLNIKGYCKETCPLQFLCYDPSKNNNDNTQLCLIQEVENKELKNKKVQRLQIPDDVDIKADYVAIINNKEYDILDFEPESSLLKINVISLQDKSCRSYANKMSSIDIQKNTSIDITLKKKQLQLNEYQKIGKKLKELNDSLYKYKSKINKTVIQNNTQRDIIKSIDVRSYIYYAIFGIAGLILLGVMLLDADKNKKIYASITVCLIVIIMNVVNYFMSNKYIENFDLQKINDILKDQTNKVNNIKKAKDIFDEVIVEILKYYDGLNKINIINDTNSLILSSLNDEVRIFEDKNKTFQYTLNKNNEAIEIMKHETIQKTGFINFISISFLIFVILFTFSLLLNNNIKLFAILFVIFETINMYQYYYTILHPVRVKPRNKYWYTLSNSFVNSV